MKAFEIYDILLLLAAVTAGCFLIYSLIRRRKLGISLTHPRILLEFFIVLISIILFLWSMLK